MINELNFMIKETRISKGYSQEELAARSGVSVRSIQRIENGESTPRGSTLQLISKALEVDLAVLLPEEKTNKKSTNETNAIQLMYLVTLAGLIMPFGNAIAPAIVLAIKRGESEVVSKIGKNIIYTQLLFTIVLTTIGMLAVFGKLMGQEYTLEIVFLGGLVCMFINYGWSLYAGIKTKETIKRYYIGFYKL